MAVDVEIIDFSIPTCNRKNLFVTNIPHIDECHLYDTLYEEFSRFGLLHEIQIFPCKAPPGGLKNSDQGFYAFVKFYSYRAATCARQNLNDKLTIGDKQCKVNYAKRRKGDNQVTTLQLSKCYELASHYLGFNGWSSKMLVMEQDKEADKDMTSDLTKIRFYCKVGLELTGQNLSCDGFGAWEETLARNDNPSRGGVMAKARKLSYMRAMQHAFSKLLLVSLSNGKVWVEVNTTLPDQRLQDNQVEEEQLLKVNELTEEPIKEEADFSGNMDDLNLQILQELEEQLG